jgi:hypothetical protein
MGPDLLRDSQLFGSDLDRPERLRVVDIDQLTLLVSR